MYAVVRTGGKQHKVAAGDTIVVERISGDVGDTVELADVVFLGTDKGAVAGKAALSKAKIQATILEQHKDDKVIVFKFKRRKGYKRTRGHRQPITTLMIEQIDDGHGKTEKAPARAAARPAEKKAQAKAKPAAKAKAAAKPKAAAKTKAAAKAKAEGKPKVQPAKAAKPAGKKPAQTKAASAKAAPKKSSPSKPAGKPGAPTSKGEAKNRPRAATKPSMPAKKAPGKKTAPKKTGK